MSAEKVRRRKYRTGVNAKNLKQICIRASEELRTFIEMHSYDENGRKLSKAKVLDNMVAFIGDRMMSRNLR